MQILFGIRIAVMMPVIGGPPEHTLLSGHSGHEGHHKLKGAAGLKRAVGKIAVVSGRNKKHARVIKGQANDQIRPMKFQKKGGQAGQVDNYEWQRAYVRYAIAAPESDPTERHASLPRTPGSFRQLFRAQEHTAVSGAPSILD